MGTSLLTSQSETRGQASYLRERALCLVEAAAVWHKAGRLDRALAVLAQLPNSGDTHDAGLDQVELAASLYELGRSNEADQHLEAVRAGRPRRDVCAAAAELCIDRGELRDALRWYDLAVSTMSAAELADAATAEGCFSGPALVLRCRQDLRAELGYAADVLDQSVPDIADVVEERPFPTTGELLNEPVCLTGVQGRTLFWPAPDLAAAAQTWPQVFHDDAGYHHELERRFRRLSERTGRGLELVPGHVQLLAAFLAETGRDVADSSTRHAFMESRVAAGAVMSWPPGRNEACWCGSGSKYKKCCAQAGF